MCTEVHVCRQSRVCVCAYIRLLFRLLSPRPVNELVLLASATILPAGELPALGEGEDVTTHRADDEKTVCPDDDDRDVQSFDDRHWDDEWDQSQAEAPRLVR